MKFDSPRPDEMSLVYDAWANSFRKSPFAGCIPNHLFDEVSRADISGLLDQGSRVIVATQDIPEGERRVMGYSVSEPHIPALHWLYVKRDYRKMGVGKALLRETIRDWPVGSVFDSGHPPYYFTHKTRMTTRFLRSDGFNNPGADGWIWDDSLARIKAAQRVSS